MPTEQAEKLNDVFPSVLETIAFMFADTADADELTDPVDPPIYQTEIEFTGPSHGRLTLLAPEAICDELMMNMLGMEPDEQGEHIPPDEALKELLNVTCGQLLTAMAGDEPVFDLTPPVVTQPEADQWQSMVDDPETFAFTVDDIPLLLRLSLDE